ncbi:MAG TPA: DNA-binding transcriptional regulator Fis [Gammaproteobacteria bacterium]|nr:DNA-binding transcriptional regulator Fis [Gammaproteobacteria bacterium]
MSRAASEDSAARSRAPSRKDLERPLGDCVRIALEGYFRDLDGHGAADVYRMVLGEVEPALLQTVVNYAEGNQTRAAEILGITRSTLRKKLKQYGIEIE